MPVASVGRQLAPGSARLPGRAKPGVLAVTVCAYLSAVYLTWDAQRLDDEEMRRYFHVRAIGAAVVAGVVAFVGLLVFRSDATYLYDGLTSRALPLVIISALCGVGSLILLVRGKQHGARVLSAGAVASVVVAWGVAQWPYMLPTSLKVSAAASPSGTLQAVLVVAVLALVIIVPAFVLLYVLDQKGILPEEGAESPSAASA